jgi:hypothetical protein
MIFMADQKLKAARWIAANIAKLPELLSKA